jgi:hypothetical protein
VFCKWPSPVDSPASNSSVSPSRSIRLLESKRQHNQTGIGRNAQHRQNNHSIPRSPKLLPPHPVVTNLTEELSIALVASVYRNEQDPTPIRRKQCANAVELGREDLDHYECEGELAECRAYICAFEGALSCADLDESVFAESDVFRAVIERDKLLWSENDRTSAMESKMEVVFWVRLQRR